MGRNQGISVSGEVGGLVSGLLGVKGPGEEGQLATIHQKAR